MDPQADAELRALRTRAYGPEADIFDDAAALARLEELEALAQRAARPERQPTVGAPSSGATVAVASPATPARREAAETTTLIALDATEDATLADATDIFSDPAAATTDLSDAAAQPRRRWARAVLVGASALLVVVVITALVTSFVTRRSGYEASAEAVLVPDPVYELPDFFGPQGNEMEVYTAFYGMRPFTTASYYEVERESGDKCIQIFDETADFTANTYSGSSIFGGCGTVSFPPSSTFRVSEGSPEALRARYPDGTELQFVLEGNEITVLAGPAPDMEASAIK